MTEVYVYFVVKLWSIISSDRLRYSELADDILPHKLGDVLIFDGGEGFSFYPFAKVVSGNQQQLFLSEGCRWWSNYIDSPLCKGSKLIMVTRS